MIIYYLLLYNPSTDLADVAPCALLTGRRDNQAVAARPVIVQLDTRYLQYGYNPHKYLDILIFIIRYVWT